MKSILIKDTTKEERIAIVKEWLPVDDGFEDGCIDLLWEMYDPYIRGEKEVAECNASFNRGFFEDRDGKAAPGCGEGQARR